MSSLFVNLFIVGYLYFAWSWSLAEPYRRLPLAPLSKLIWWIGLWHNWNMFAPPTMTKRYLYAQITLANGDTIRWQAPRSHELPLIKAFLRFRVAKFCYALYSSEHLRDSFCQYLLRCHTHIFAQMGQQPTEVRLYCWCEDVPPPGQKLVAQPMKEWDLFRYTVPPESVLKGSSPLPVTTLPPCSR